MEEEEGRAGLREIARFPDVMVVCSSAGWTDQKHMLYLGLLQESFVNRLHDGEISFRGLFDLSPGASGPKQPSKVDRAKVERTRPPCCGNQGDGEALCVEEEEDDDDDASSTETVRQSYSQASATSSGRSSPCHSGKRGRSPSSTAEFGDTARFLQGNCLCISSEGSDQNFIDEDTITRETGESREGRRRSIKRLKVC
ncbi:uncharacterized protein LOC119362963 isoform X1 [Triticum dicoccoides]|uniref:uncharacterized protein LOC119362963 isoform X1 n=1 Tax=Triticum dicoccoides TaxID=85692 RepID=UPI00188DD533|nr:uncharacterized protein LOC119362963 isoform X1 [Triticum dicoccoides]